jgi:hypothetical protein
VNYRPGPSCLACQMPAPPPEQTCTLGRDHRVGTASGCPACGCLIAACARRPCSAKKVLIADDVADSGRTIELVYTFIKDHVADVRSAVIYEKPRSLIRCDYVWKHTDLWINFLWSSMAPVVQRAGQVFDA